MNTLNRSEEVVEVKKTNKLEGPFALRAELKEEVKALRELKYETKDAQRNGGNYPALQFKLYVNKRNYRHRHIACCELFGRTRDEIEAPRDDNQPCCCTIQEIGRAHV